MAKFELGIEETKPPIGIIPQEIWIEKRVVDLSETIHRYIMAGYPIPSEWVIEFQSKLEIWNKKRTQV